MLRLPPDWEPPGPDDPEARSVTLIAVLSVFAAGMVACVIAFALLR